MPPVEPMKCQRERAYRCVWLSRAKRAAEIVHGANAQHAEYPRSEIGLISGRAEWQKIDELDEENINGIARAMCQSSSRRKRLKLTAIAVKQPRSHRPQ